MSRKGVLIYRDKRQSGSYVPLNKLSKVIYTIKSYNYLKCLMNLKQEGKFVKSLNENVLRLNQHLCLINLHLNLQIQYFHHFPPLPLSHPSPILLV